MRKLALCIILAVYSLAAVAQSAQAHAPTPATPPANDLVRFVRLKITAGDLSSGLAMIEDHRRAKGVDSDYLNALGWLTRGAEILGRLELADELLRDLKKDVPKEAAETLIPYGAAIETEGRLILRRQGRGAAIRYFEQQLAAAQATSLRSRISKNINLIALEGQAAPVIRGTSIGSGKNVDLASLRGRPTLLYLFAEWCGDCKAQAHSLTRVWEKYRDRGLQLVAVTRHYSTPTDKNPMTSAEETAKVQTVWKESYPGLSDVPVVIDTEAMVRYGASATPSFALVDQKGIVRLYTATRLSEVELSKHIEEVLANR